MASRMRVTSVLLRLSLDRGSIIAISAPQYLLPSASQGGARCLRYSQPAAFVSCPSAHSLGRRELSTNTGSSSSSSSSGSSSSSSNDDQKAASGAKADVEQPAQQQVTKGQWGNRARLTYEGSMAHHVRRLKRVSITTCLISILAVPAVVKFGKDSVPVAGQAAVMGTALAGAGGSTMLLNLCVSPYVFRMAEISEGDEGGDEDGGGEVAPRRRRTMKSSYGIPKRSGRRFRVERLNIFGMRKTTEFSLDEVEPMPNTSRPFVSFKAAGEYYFIQGHDMADKALLEVLLGRELKDHEK